MQAASADHHSPCLHLDHLPHRAPLAPVPLTPMHLSATRPPLGSLSPTHLLSSTRASITQAPPSRSTMHSLLPRSLPVTNAFVVRPLPLGHQSSRRSTAPLGHQCTRQPPTPCRPLAHLSAARPPAATHPFSATRALVGHSRTLQPSAHGPRCADDGKVRGSFCRPKPPPLPAPRASNAAGPPPPKRTALTASPPRAEPRSDTRPEPIGAATTMASGAGRGPRRERSTVALPPMPPAPPRPPTRVGAPLARTSAPVSRTTEPPSRAGTNRPARPSHRSQSCGPQRPDDPPRLSPRTGSPCRVR